MSHSFGPFQDFTTFSIALETVWMQEQVTEPIIAQLYNVRDSERAREDTGGIGSFHNVPEFTGQMTAASVDVLGTKTYEHVQYSNFREIPRKLIDDGQLDTISQIVAAFAISYERTWATHMSSVFNNAFATVAGKPAYTAYDGKPLCDTGRSSGKQQLSNEGSSPLTHDALQSTVEAMMQFKDSNGNHLMVVPDTLVVPVALRGKGLELVGSELQPGTANNDINSEAGMSLIVDRFLTDPNNWFIVDSRLSRRYLRWFWRNRPTDAGGFVVDPSADFDLVARARGYMRYSFGFDDFFWIYGHKVA